MWQFADVIIRQGSICKSNIDYSGCGHHIGSCGINMPVKLFPKEFLLQNRRGDHSAGAVAA
jgi:hypothetical protein